MGLYTVYIKYKRQSHARLQFHAVTTVETLTITYLQECKSLAHTLNKQALSVW